MPRAGGKIGVLGGCSAHQRGDVVGQDLGGHVDDEGLLARPRDGFEVQPMFEPLESFLDAPALACRVNSGPGRNRANRRWSATAAERLSRQQGRSAGINKEASAATTRRPHQRAIRPASSARRTTRSLSPTSAGMRRRSRALANALSETSRSKDSLPHTEAKKPSSMVCWDGLRVLSISSGVFA